MQDNKAQELVNLLVTDKAMADTHVVDALVHADVPLNIGVALAELRQVFGDKDILVITNELAYTANDIVAAKNVNSADSATHFYHQLMLTDKAALVKAITVVMEMEKSV
jgi:hypothetical protein